MRFTSSHVAPRDHSGVNLHGIIGKLEERVKDRVFFLRLRGDSGIHVIPTEGTNVFVKRYEVTCELGKQVDC